jgi:AcrR family transcriptional regulator
VARPRTVSDEQILEATRAAVRRHGPSVSLDTIAGRLHVSQPALLKRFKTRNKLFIAALMPPETPPFLKRLEAGPGDEPIGQQLEEVLSEMASFFDEIAPLLSALRESGIPNHEAHPKRPHLAALNALAGWLVRATQRGLLDVADPEAAAVAVLASVFTPAMMCHHLGKRTWKRNSSQMVPALSSLWAKAFHPAVR